MTIIVTVKLQIRQNYETECDSDLVISIMEFKLQ